MPRLAAILKIGKADDMTVEHVPGKKVGHIMLYALSTCGWCSKTKKLLDDLGVEYYYTYVDHLEGEDRMSATAEVERWNPRRSFPTLIIDDTTCIIGFKEDEIKKAIKA
jgi:glutaredoxin-like protein NrdH